MRKIFYALCFVMLLASCQSNNNKIKNDWEKLDLNGNVQTIRMKSYYDEKGVTENMAASTVFEFNKKGFITEILGNSGDKINLIFKYDSVDRKSIVENFTNGKHYVTYKYKYNGYNIAEISTEDSEGVIYLVLKYEYDKNGNRTKKTGQRPGEIVKFLRKYDDAGNVTEEKIEDGSYRHYTFKYINKKYLVEKNTFDESGVKIKTEVFDAEKKIIDPYYRIDGEDEDAKDPGSISYENFKGPVKMKCGEKTVFEEKEFKTECDKLSNWIKLFVLTENITHLSLEREITYY